MILKGNMSCIRGSLEIPLLSLDLAHFMRHKHGGNLALLMGISLRQSDAAHRVNSVLSLSDVKRIQVLKVSYFDDMRACQRLRLSLWISLHIWCHADVGVMA